jgi:anti-sigma regulatory factor (Ser/Thr protein kinase)
MESRIFIESDVKNWKEVVFFLEKHLHKKGTQENKIIMACEEIFINICKYAYKKVGQVEILFDFDGKTAKIEIIDSGVAFNPLSFSASAAKEVNKNLKERKIGGMGIYMVKNIMDKIEYKRKNGKNCLSMFKNLYS